MDFVEGTLETHKANTKANKPEIQHLQPSNLSEFVEMVIQLLKGLDWLHSGAAGEGKIYHRDIKPSNVGFVRIGVKVIWKLLDFGLAKQIPLDKNTVISPYARGTGVYMSPQQALGQGRPNDDIYSLGITFYQILYDWRFPSDASLSQLVFSLLPEVFEYTRYLRKEIREEPSDFRNENRSLGSPFSNEVISDEGIIELDEILFRMFKFNHQHRYKSAKEVIKSFENWRNKHLSL